MKWTSHGFKNLELTLKASKSKLMLVLESRQVLIYLLHFLVELTQTDAHVQPVMNGSQEQSQRGSHDARAQRQQPQRGSHDAGTRQPQPRGGSHDMCTQRQPQLALHDTRSQQQQSQQGLHDAGTQQQQQPKGGSHDARAQQQQSQQGLHDTGTLQPQPHGGSHDVGTQQQQQPKGGSHDAHTQQQPPRHNNLTSTANMTAPLPNAHQLLPRCSNTLISATNTTAPSPNASQWPQPPPDQDAGSKENEPVQATMAPTKGVPRNRASRVKGKPLEVRWTDAESTTLLEAILGPDATKLFGMLATNSKKVFKNVCSIFLDTLYITYTPLQLSANLFNGSWSWESVHSCYTCLQQLYILVWEYMSFTGGAGDADVDPDADPS